MTSAALKTDSLAPMMAPYPVTIRLPKNGETDPWFGWTRTSWNQKILECAANEGKPPIKSIVEKKRPGAKRGVRLILFDSARRYVERLAREQTSTQCAA
jgi:hypothetical protein